MRVTGARSAHSLLPVCQNRSAYGHLQQGIARVYGVEIETTMLEA